jgi:hypothetical protein
MEQSCVRIYSVLCFSINERFCQTQQILYTHPIAPRPGSQDMRTMECLGTNIALIFILFVYYLVWREHYYYTSICIDVCTLGTTMNISVNTP